MGNIPPDCIDLADRIKKIVLTSIQTAQGKISCHFKFVPNKF